jgi:hypothetical protein
MATWQQGGSGDDPSTACVTATFRSGQNSNSGPWEYRIMDQAGTVVGGNFAWGSSGSQLSSGNVSVSLAVPQGGGSGSPVVFGLAGTNSINFGSATYGNITKIGFDVQCDDSIDPESIEWTSLTITFQDSTGTPHSYSVSGSQLPVATYSSGSDYAYWVCLPDSGYIMVSATITGTIQLQAGAVRPGPNAIVGDIYVWTDSCTAG